MEKNLTLKFRIKIQMAKKPESCVKALSGSEDLSVFKS